MAGHTPERSSDRSAATGAPDFAAKEAIRGKAFEMGFDAAGFARAGAPPADGANLAAFLDGGRHGDMTWLADTFARRADPRALWPEARTVIALGVNYGPAEDPRALQGRADRGAISVYARNRDYHDVVKKRVKRLARWIVETRGGEVKVFVDTAPVMEKPLAARAGIGWQGKHTNLVSRAFGSWLFLAEVFTTLTLPPDAPETDLCGSCNRCAEACPTDALAEPYRMNATRCISYVTIEHKGPIEADLRPALGNRIYGCDDCLAACPWNKFSRPTAEAAFQARPDLKAPSLADLAGLDDVAFRQAFAGTPIKRTGRDRLLRNVLIAIGNSGDAGMLSVVRQRMADSSALVREAAQWAFDRLSDQPPAKG
ncbi:MAG: tRNA epoxyqueuosine(34) reductase QueG [Rhodospirillales bacterium]|nr:tRNA epoxyqueuosine(34) reductase QueG [Rhodospirillales bacterium]